ncbi:cytokine-like protein 1 isoform X2 [Betta splendens]|uniref:Cytokine-like protein 1 isoform X2 n=1 Tax=Betta splendens TaxID=158456 RepID=A0A9W2XTJ9_BETSP|nr:cytokine-like protein 1 isoform X2 [Betta splendens]
MRLEFAALLCAFCFVRLSHCAPPTCYSRALKLGKEVMVLLDTIHTSSRTTCAEMLPRIFIDVHNSCITAKLRDFLYVILNQNPVCKERRRMMMLRQKVQILYRIITMFCYRSSQDLVFLSDDCEAIDTGRSHPYNGEDRLQLLQEDR